MCVCVVCVGVYVHGTFILAHTKVISKPLYLSSCQCCDCSSLQIGSYVDININNLVPLDALDVDPEVKQLFIDVFHCDPQLRPGALELLNRPIISSAVEYGRYFDECYDSEDAEDLEASPATECENSIPIADVPQHISLTSSGGQISMHSLGDEVGELPQIPCGNNPLQRNRGSQDSGVGDVENSVGSSVMFGSQMSTRSSSSGSNRSGNQQRLSHQDSGLEDSMIAMAGECSQPGGK